MIYFSIKGHGLHGYGYASPNIAAYSAGAYGHGISYAPAVAKIATPAIAHSSISTHGFAAGHGLGHGYRYGGAVPAISTLSAVPVAHVQPTISHAIAQPVYDKHVEHYVCNSYLHEK